MRFVNSKNVLGKFSAGFRGSDSTSNLRNLLLPIRFFSLSCHLLLSFLLLKKELSSCKNQFNFMKITNYAIVLKPLFS